MKVLVNTAGWELDAEAETGAAPATPEAGAKPGSGVFPKTNVANQIGDHSPESFSPTEPAPASDDPALDVVVPPPPSIPKID